jgi:hypothetical protein
VLVEFEALGDVRRLLVGELGGVDADVEAA